jgi:protein involved in polysaccharide export with SLBB domain
MINYLLRVLALASAVFAFSQTMDKSGIAGLLQNNSGLLSSMGIESSSVQKYLDSEREKGNGGMGVGKQSVSDSSNLFLPKDEALMKPVKNDTLFYVIVQDTVSMDSLMHDSTIIERIGRMPDPTKLIVKRRLLVDRASLRGPERYEVSFFRDAPTSVFGSTTNAINGDYPLKAGDKLVLTIWGEVEKEYPITINNQGNVNVEGIGLNSLNGLTLGQAQEVLKLKLIKIYAGIRSSRIFVNLRLESLSPVKIFLVGEVAKPGGYVFYGNTTVFQALYQAGGPNNLGTVRNIQITRGDTTFTVDLYDYLMQGKKPEPSVLNDGDIVFLPRAEILAQARGDMGRPAIYELKKGEGVRELLQYAGQVNPSAAEQRMVLQRYFPGGKQDYMDLKTPKEYMDSTASLPLQDGDVLWLTKSTDKPKEFVTIIGAVKYPGTYQFKSGMTVPDVVQVAGGALEETYMGRVQILRPLPTGGYNMLSQPLQGSVATPLVQRDTLIVFSLKDLHTPDSVTITGAVEHPGRFEYYQGVTAKDLILSAGGFLPNREVGKIRLEHVRSDSRGMEVEALSITDNYESEAGGQILLKPWDHLEVPIDPNFQRPQMVKLAGAFKSPGSYALLHPGEKLMELIDRAGGFQQEAYLVGAQFYRNKDSIGQIGFDLKAAMAGSKRDNIELQDGDSLFVSIPKVHIRVVGEVGYPSNVLYKPGKSIAWYISQAGGFRETSDLDRVMIRFANGAVSTEFDADREPDPGSMIIVPFKTPPPPVNWYVVASTFAGLITAAATLMIAYKK